MNIELIQKLHLSTEIVDGCWLWRGSLSDGYGYIRYNGSYWRLHRLSVCLYTKVPYQGNWTANHLCRNKNCWNPLHLYQGDMSSNTLDTVTVGNHYFGKNNADKLRCKKGHEYNYVTKEGKRRCTICDAENRSKTRERHAKLKQRFL